MTVPTPHRVVRRSLTGPVPSVCSQPEHTSQRDRSYPSVTLGQLQSIALCKSGHPAELSLI
eukprot:3701001-Rhodomonas_salina.1